MNDNTPDKTGTFWGMPYDWRKPTLARFKSTMWNPATDRIMVPKDFGWGYSINLHALGRRLRLIRR